MKMTHFQAARELGQVEYGLWMMRTRPTPFEWHRVRNLYLNAFYWHSHAQREWDFAVGLLYAIDRGYIEVQWGLPGFAPDLMRLTEVGWEMLQDAPR